MFSGVFYAVPSDPLPGDTVTAKMVIHMKHFLERFEIFPKAFKKYSLYVSIRVRYVVGHRTARKWNMGVDGLHFDILRQDKKSIQEYGIQINLWSK